MPAYYLRVAATNFAAFIGDTEHLPAIRGGSLQLRRAVQLVAERFAGRLEAVSTGASEGLFRFDVPSSAEAAALRRGVVDVLADPPRAEAGLRHATFTVDVVASSGDFRRDRQAALAAGRWRQLQAPSLAVPGQVAGDSGPYDPEPCALDRLRPGDHRHRLDGAPISRSVALRRDYGRQAKQRFYHQEAGVDTELRFCNSFQELTGEAPEQGPLEGKMAVVYIDGNSFGAIQRRLVSSVAEQRAFDRDLQDKRRRMLRDLIDAADGLASMHQGEQGRLRLETLLWGGDEVVWVVPAWAGLWLLARFYRHASTWDHRGEPLRHAAGLVFCQHKAPIHRMRRLAEQLGELAKSDRSRDLAAYEVLESFDDVGDDLEAYRAARAPAGLDADALVLDGTRLEDAQRAFARVRRHLPARRVRAAAEAARSGSDEELRSAAKAVYGVLEPAARSALDQLLLALSASEAPAEGSDRGSWHHLAALADYLAPPEELTDA